MKLIEYKGKIYNLKLTKHAEIRLRERGITLIDIQKVLSNYDRFYESHGEYVTEKNIDGREIKIVFTLLDKDLILITTIIKGK